MWNKENPINMLSAVRQDFEVDTIKAIQKHIDIDKFLNSSKLRFDLCGYYAPFCDYCSKIGSYPCAYAFFKYKECTHSNESISEVLEKAHEVKEEPIKEIEEVNETKEEVKEENYFANKDFEQLDFDTLYEGVEPTDNIISDDPFVDESEIIEQVTETEKRTFRLAVARRKTL